MENITSKDDYVKAFGTLDLRKQAFRYALDNRKFEIELYWKRASYFWALVVTALVGYITLLGIGKDPSFEGLFLVACMGLVLSLSWYLVNRGSKYWMTNWEHHVDLLEDEIVGPLYKTVIAKDTFSFFKVFNAYPYSVSRINQILSLFFVVIWLVLLCYSFKYVSWAKHAIAAGLLGVITIAFCLLLLFHGKASRTGETAFDLETRQLRNKKRENQTPSESSVSPAAPHEETANESM